MSSARGALPLNGHAFFALNDAIYDILPSGITNAIYGPIVNDGLPVYLAASPTQLVFCSGGVAYFIEAGVLAPVSWLVGVEVIDVGFINKYFVFLAAVGDGFYFSEPGDADSGDLLNFRTAEASASKFKRIIVNDERVWLIGDLVTQAFANDPNDAEEPFKPDLSLVIQWGTCAPASVIQFNGTFGWLDRTKTGQGQARMMNGGTPQRISTFAVEEAWRSYPTIDDCWAKTFVDFWFPTANVTWRYDASLPPQLGWTKALFYNDIGQFEADLGVVACSLEGKVLVGDRNTGDVYECSLDFLDDNGDRIRWLRRAPIIENELKNVFYDRFQLDMEVGVGDGSNGDPDLGDVTPEFDPLVMFRYSNDWAKNWSMELLRSLGQQGDYGKQVYWNRVGMGRQRVFEISGTASCRICINNAYLDAEESLS